MKKLLGWQLAVVIWLLAVGTAGAQAELPGDANGDCRVSIADYVILLTYFGQTIAGGNGIYKVSLGEVGMMPAGRRG